MLSVGYLYFEDPGNRDFSVGADPYTKNMCNFTHLGIISQAPACGY